VFMIFLEAAVEPHWQGTGPGFSILFALVRPVSRGSLRLRSSNPFEHPLIDPAYLSEQCDVDSMVVALRMAREIAHDTALKPWRGTELLPGAEVCSEDDCREFLRRNTGSYFHPAGTCRIGSDDFAVVDPELRVHGIDGLRVVDASVMPPRWCRHHLMRLCSGSLNGQPISSNPTFCPVKCGAKDAIAWQEHSLALPWPPRQTPGRSAGRTCPRQPARKSSRRPPVDPWPQP
jgi:hypothetical protein